jgi:hypothetical protein
MPTLSVISGALEHRDPQTAAGDALLADAAGSGQVDARLDLIREPKHSWTGAGLDDSAQGVGPGGEIRE